jgi:hypothetical protein
LQWTAVKSGGIPPPPVEKAAVALVENRVFLMGGNCGDSGDADRGIQVMQGLFELDLEVRVSRIKMRLAKIGNRKKQNKRKGTKNIKEKKKGKEKKIRGRNCGGGREATWAVGVMQGLSE